MKHRWALYFVSVALLVAGCGKKAPEAGQNEQASGNAAAEDVAPAAAENAQAPEAQADAKAEPAKAAQAPEKPWDPKPDYLKDGLCLKGNCKCGDGFCAKNAWCIQGECFCGHNSPWYSEYEEGSDTYKPDCENFGWMLKTKDYGEFTCDWMDRNPHFLCEKEGGCKTRKGKVVPEGEFVTSKTGNLTLLGFRDSPAIALCGREAAEKLRRDISKFEVFASKLSQIREPEGCAEVGPMDEFDLECLRSAQEIVDTCEIRRNCDTWFVPRDGRDRYVCEFDVGVRPDTVMDGAHYYPKPVGLRCDHEDGCACAYAHIAKGQYCNDGVGASAPKYKGVPLPDADAEDIIRPLKEPSFVEQYSGGFKWADLEKSLEVPKLKLAKMITGDELGKKLSDKANEDYFRACQIKETKKLSGGVEVSFITCESVNSQGEVDEGCCESGEVSSACSGGFIALHASADDSYRVYAIGKLPEACCAMDNCAVDNSYALGDVSMTSFLDTKAVHVSIAKYSREGALSEWPENGMFCGMQTFGLSLEHYVFAGSKFRMVGHYPEYELRKGVRHSDSEAHCGEFVHAELMTGKLTLKDGDWTYVNQSGRIDLDLSDPEDMAKNRRLGKEAEEKDEEANFIIPDIQPQYKPYLQYSRRNYMFDADALKDFYKHEKTREESGKLDAELKAFKGIQLKATY